jgi:putative membrane protein
MEPQGQSIEKGLVGNPGGTGKPDLVLDTATELDFARTRNSYEQTMMSWIRTATSLITFGFSIYKFFQIEGPAAHTVRNYLIGPREFSLMLVSIGMVSLVLATFDYRRSIRLLGARYPGASHSLAIVVAGLMSVLGILALLAMIFRQ